MDLPSGKRSHSWLECPYFLIGDTSSKGPFSIAMLVYRSVLPEKLGNLLAYDAWEK